MSTGEFISLLFEGLFSDFLLTLLSCVMPIAVGIGMSLLLRDNDELKKPVKFVSMFFESLSPAFVLLAIYFCILPAIDSAFLISVIGFTVSFLGYMPLHANPKYSVMKNLIVNSIGLFQKVFMWSFCAGLIGSMGMYRAVSLCHISTFAMYPYWIGLLISSVILLACQLARYFAEEKLPDNFKQELFGGTSSDEEDFAEKSEQAQDF